MLQLYKNIKNRRKELGMTQSELAKKLGYTDKSMISKIENGSIDLPQSKIIAFANALDISPSDLMGWEDEPILPSGAVPADISAFVQLPILGCVRCGEPMYAESNIEGYQLTASEDIFDGYEYFYLRAKGDSMINAGISEGDLLLIRKQSDVESGDIAIINIDGDNETLKRVIKKDGAIILQPENSSYETKIFMGKELDSIHIQGRLMQVVKKF